MKNNGFTLIEILIAMAVFMLISATTYAGFTQFRTQQSLNVAYETLKNTIYETKSYARSQVVKTNACTADNMVLVGHEIKKVDGNNYYSINEVCYLESAPGNIISDNLKNIEFSSNVNITPFAMRFNILTGTVFNPPSGPITITQGSRSRSITVNSNGIIE